MVEIFQGAPAEVKREMGDFFTEHPHTRIEWAMQDHIGFELCVTIIYREPEEPVTQEEVDFGN